MSAVERAQGMDRVPELELTRMRRRHLRRVLAIEGQVYPCPWSASLFLSELADGSARTYLVAKVEGEVIGYAGMMFMGDEGTRHEHRGGSRIPRVRQGGNSPPLRDHHRSHRAGAEVISLEVRVSNRIAETMYEKFGFSRGCGHPQGLLRGRPIYALIMTVSNARSTEYRLRLQVIRDRVDSLRNSHE